MRDLAARGAREQILIAQDTTRYGTDGQEGSLARLLQTAQDIPGIDWLRVLYCYPDETDRALVDTMASLPKVCRYLDLPLQHAAPGVLRRMRRRGDIRETENLLLYARERGFALRTTMIVGFPGETDAEFQELMDFCARVRFDRLGAFAFSREEDTPAYRMKNQIPEAVKQERLDALMARQRGISLERGLSRVGSVEEVLVTGAEKGLFVGRSRWEAPDSDGLIRLTGASGLTPGQMVRVRINQAAEYDLSAEVLPGGPAS
jgi:ribosomal protein S12 methylthiotransferase